MAIDYEKMGKRIKRRREDLNISQEQLGASLLTSNVHISNIENGSRAPSLDLFVAIANALEVSADDLLANSLTVSSSPVGQELHDRNRKISNRLTNPIESARMKESLAESMGFS
jgi:transcriptional regulator with XRE-family HTH domain